MSRLLRFIWVKTSFADTIAADSIAVIQSHSRQAGYRLLSVGPLEFNRLVECDVCEKKPKCYQSREVRRNRLARLTMVCRWIVLEIAKNGVYANYAFNRVLP